MHQGIGLDGFNDMPMQKAVHAVYECCNSVPLAGDLLRDRPYHDHDQLFQRADELLYALSEDSLDAVLQAYPHIPHAEQCPLSDELRTELARINRTRLERMLGPEGGYQNW